MSVLQTTIPIFLEYIVRHIIPKMKHENVLSNVQTEFIAFGIKKSRKCDIYISRTVNVYNRQFFQFYKPPKTPWILTSFFL